MQSESVDLVYVDPPFFTQKQHTLTNRQRTQRYAFDDRWNSREEYLDFIRERLQEFRRVLRQAGSLFFHCDASANHLARLALDEIFGEERFRAEIIWQYRRWSNSQRTPMPSHQTLLFYTRSATYKYNQLFEDYSPSTNIDQILQKRARGKDGKARYARDTSGEILIQAGKMGVPISDVWDIPLLNPKATERTGYPTQKPVLLLDRIIKLVTDEGDLVLDPFCGSGTTLVAAALGGRKAVGIDISEAAVRLSRTRLANPARSNSNILTKGRNSYAMADLDALAMLTGIPVVAVHRNKGIDAVAKGLSYPGPVFFRIQRPWETIEETCHLLFKACVNKKPHAAFAIATVASSIAPEWRTCEFVHVIKSTAMSALEILNTNSVQQS